MNGFLSERTNTFVYTYFLDILPLPLYPVTTHSNFSVFLSHNSFLIPSRNTTSPVMPSLILISNLSFLSDLPIKVSSLPQYLLFLYTPSIPVLSYIFGIYLPFFHIFSKPLYRFRHSNTHSLWYIRPATLLPLLIRLYSPMYDLPIYPFTTYSPSFQLSLSSLTSFPSLPQVTLPFPSHHFSSPTHPH